MFSKEDLDSSIISQSNKWFDLFRRVNCFCIKKSKHGEASFNLVGLDNQDWYLKCICMASKWFNFVVAKPQRGRE